MGHSSPTPPSRMNTPTLLLLMSSGLQAFHLTHVPVLSRPLVPFYFPYQFYLLQEQTNDDIVHEFRCPGPGRFPSSSDCSHFWECLGENQLLGSSSCPDGLWFEPSTGECSTPDKVGCIEIDEKMSSWNAF